MKMLSASDATCSICREPLSVKGECLACLLRAGLDETTPASVSFPLVFGDFEIARREDGSFWELGCGAMGVTYRATDRVLHRTVALKVIETPSAWGDATAVRERFLREARAAAALKHPNVAGVFQFGAAPEIDRCYYAMELVEGETLEARVRRDGPLGAELALAISIQVARALTEAAAQGLIHRDLKPSNIMLMHAVGAAPVGVKVIDFGLAKATNAVAETDLTHGGFVGTPSFASPEQFDNATADARSDIYSLGVTLWYALTGQVPYPGKTVQEIRDRQQRTDLPVEQLAERKIPAALIDIVRRTLALDPTLRPASARELLEALESCRAALIVPGKFSPRRRIRKLPALIVMFAMAPAILFAFALLRQKARVVATDATSLAEKSIAVLPFENLSKEQENAFFAGGVQDELLSDLARIADLKVISRTSVLQYQDGRNRNLREIGRTLGVTNVVEGSVQRSGNRVRVVAQLIDARTDTHLWGETYDRDLSDVFAIQTEIAEQIARQLQARISPQEEAVIAERPTLDLTAYAFYDQARTQQNMAEGSSEERVQLLQEAIRRDPNFILAYCLLAKLHTDRYVNESYSSDTDRMATAARAKDVIATALRLRPDRGEPHLAAAYHSFLSREFTEARRELGVALRLLPSDAQATFLEARLDRHENRWDDALVKARRAVALDPQNEFFVLWTSDAYSLMRRYHDGEEFVRQAKSMNPRNAGRFDGCLARFKLAEGDLVGARTLSTFPTNDLALEMQFNAAFYSRDYDAALQVIAAAPPDLVESQFCAKSPNSWAEAEVYRALGDQQRAEKAFLTLRQALDPNTNPQSRTEWYYHAAGKCDAGLHRKDEAIREARQALDMNPIAQDPINGPEMGQCLALVYAWTGERDLAIEQLAILAGMPSNISYGDLRFNPDWDSLRGDARFEKIVASLRPALITSTQ